MRVLILEDNGHCREMLVKVVESCREDVTVHAFGKRGDAYACAFEHPIDLFLVDIILEPSNKNDSSGIAFAESIRRHADYRLTPIIFITMLQGLEAHLLRQVHCYDYIEKPLGDGSLVKERLQEVLDEVVYVVNRRGVLYIYTTDDVIEIPNLSAKKFLQKVKETRFYEPVYGTAVNADYIEKVDFRNSEVFLKGRDEVLPIGGRLKKRFREEYMKWNG